MSVPRAMHVLTEEYISRGWPVLGIPPVDGRPSKAPTAKRWAEKLLKPGCAASALQNDWNVGLLLRDLADVDLDCFEAREAGRVFLPATGLIYGRASSPKSHWLYLLKGPLPYTKFILPGDGGRGDLLELRVMQPPNGLPPKAFQSVLPPSIHPCGEVYSWEKYEEAGEVSAQVLWRAVHLVAITTALARLHPPLDDAHKAERDEFRLAISGVLSKRLPGADALKVFTGALQIAGDPKDRLSIFQTTEQKIHDGRAVKGVPALIEIIREKAATPILGWIDIISDKRELSRPAPDKQLATINLPVLEDEQEEYEAATIPTCPMDAIEGDWIGDITHELTDGTSIPAIFVRENIKVILGAVINRKVGLRSHPNIHTREYHILVPPNPQACKGESWERTGGRCRGFLHGFLRNGELSAGLLMSGGIALLDGGMFGSGEFMAAILAKPENKRSIAYFDEMSECFEKDKAAGSIIEKKLLQLFEGGSITQGSFKNGVHIADGIDFSLVGCFTVPSFLRSFTGRGCAGSGFLSRCTFSYADHVSYAGDWGESKVDHIMELRGQIASCAAMVQGHSKDQPYIVEETPEAVQLRRETSEWIETLDDRYKPRLADHMKRDIILRALFSKESRNLSSTSRKSNARSSGWRTNTRIDYCSGPKMPGQTPSGWNRSSSEHSQTQGSLCPIAGSGLLATWTA